VTDEGGAVFKRSSFAATERLSWRKTLRGTDMMNTMKSWILSLAAGIAIAACATVPYTQRSQLVLLSESEEMKLGADAYQEVLAQEKVVRDPKVVGMVTDVGQRIAAVANKPEYQWQFTVIDDPKQANAFALPGGKVAVYTGIFPIARDTAGLAAIIGHEVSHAIARHGAERMSQGVLAQIAATGVAVSLGSQTPGVRNAVMQAFGLGVQVGAILPFGRAQESEADHIGLILMAKAGYDPSAALALWQRFEEAGRAGPPEFLSTHPSYGTRIQQITQWLPEARQHYQASNTAPVVGLPTAVASAR
jgi:predicted Zn-dependent protease